jgi:hypothetical protein
VHSPVPSQASATVQASPSLHATPVRGRYWPAPCRHAPAVQHGPGGVEHVTPAQGSPLQSPEAASQPISQPVDWLTYSQRPAWHVPGTTHVSDTSPAQLGAGGAVQVIAMPEQAPVASQASPCVQSSPSSQIEPAGLRAYTHVPPVHVPVSWRQSSGGASHTTRAQGSSAQSPDAASHPLAQELATASYRQVPPAHVPLASYVHDALASAQWGAGGVLQARSVPTQAPARLQTSPVVQAFPSSQGDRAGFSG